MVIPILIIFLVFYFVAVKYSQDNYRRQDAILKVACVVLTLLIGFRGNWPDVDAYTMAFEQAPFIWDFNIDTPTIAYIEKGYFLLTSVVKSIYNNPTFYFLSMGAVSMFLLYKTLDKYCIFPLIGLCDYIGRFLLNRDFTQMRSSLAILLIILVLRFVYEKKASRFFLIVLLAYQFHHMALIAIPLYFIYKIKITRNAILVWIVLAFILSQTLANVISSTVDTWSKDLQYETYIQGGYVEEALGLRNPMIYFQIAILLLFTFYEDKLKGVSKYYYLFRTSYFYSTLILIFFCNYTALSGRTSTMFATVEMFMLPMMAKAFPKSSKYVYYTGVGIILLYFFYSKYSSAMLMASGVYN